MSNWLFPLKHCNGIPIGDHPGAFGAKRKQWRHTGVDLYTNDGEPVYACETGRIVSIEHFTGEWDNSPWWYNTDAILIEGLSGVICYGEVIVENTLKVGDSVQVGDLIAKVKRVIKEGRERPDISGHSTSMLHLELYPHGIHKASTQFLESYLIDPTSYLKNANPDLVQLMA